MKLREYIVVGTNNEEIGRVKALNGDDARRQARAAGFRMFTIRWAGNWFPRRKR